MGKTIVAALGALVALAAGCEGIDYPDPPANLCADGWRTPSAGQQGACSSHGGYISSSDWEARVDRHRARRVAKSEAAKQRREAWERKAGCKRVPLAIANHPDPDPLVTKTERTPGGGTVTHRISGGRVTHHYHAAFECTVNGRTWLSGLNSDYQVVAEDWTWKR